MPIEYRITENGTKVRTGEIQYGGLNSHHIVPSGYTSGFANLLEETWGNSGINTSLEALNDKINSENAAIIDRLEGKITSLERIEEIVDERYTALDSEYGSAIDALGSYQYYGFGLNNNGLITGYNITSYNPTTGNMETTQQVSTFDIYADTFRVMRAIDAGETDVAGDGIAAMRDPITGDIQPAFLIDWNDVTQQYNTHFNGVVSFRNLANGDGETIIDGGKLTTEDVYIANQLVIGSDKSARHFGPFPKDDYTTPNDGVDLNGNTYVEKEGIVLREGDSYFDVPTGTNFIWEGTSWVTMQGKDSSGINIDLSEDTFIAHRNGAGEWDVTNAVTTIQLYNGTAIVTSHFDISVTEPGFTLVGNVLSYTGTLTGDKPSATATIVVTPKAEKVSDGTYEDILELSKVYRIITLEDGSALSLEVDQPVIRLSPDGSVPSGESITIHVKRKVGNYAPEYVAYNVYTAGDVLVGTTPTNSSGLSVLKSALVSPGDTGEVSLYIKYDDGSILANQLIADVETLPIIWDAGSPYILQLTNNVAIIPAASNGNVSPDWLDGDVSTGFKAYLGGRDVTAFCTLKVISASNGWATDPSVGTTNATTISIANVGTEDVTEVVLELMYGGVPTGVTSTFTVSKNRQGEANTSAFVYTINMSSQVISCDSDYVSPVTSVSWNVSKVNSEGVSEVLGALPAGWEVKYYDGNASNLWGFTGGNTSGSFMVPSLTRTLDSQFAVALYDNNNQVIDIENGSFVKGGVDGLTGSGTNIIFIRSSSTPSAPTASEGIPSGWSDNPPIGTELLWASTGSKGEGSDEYVWGNPYPVEGEAVAEITIYSLNNTSVSGGSYNFSTSTLTAPSGWSLNAPNLNNNGDIVYARTGLFVGTKNQTNVTTSWSAATIYSRRVDGTSGSPGSRGATSTSYNVLNPSTTVSYIQYYFELATGLTDYVRGDTLILTNTSSTSGWTREYRRGSASETAWSYYAFVMNGDVFVDGTLNAAKLETNALQLSPSSANSGAGYVASSGVTPSAWTNTGVFLGYNSSNTPVLNVGNSTNYARWDGSSFKISGDIVAGSGNFNRDSVNASYVAPLTATSTVSSGFHAAVFGFASGGSGQGGVFTGPYAGVQGAITTSSSGAAVVGQVQSTTADIFQGYSYYGTVDKKFSVSYNGAINCIGGINIVTSTKLARGYYYGYISRFYSTASGGTNTINIEGSTGNITATGTITPFTGAHHVVSSTTPAVGDIVEVTDHYPINVNNVIYKSTTTSSQKSKACYGVYNGHFYDVVQSEHFGINNTEDYNKVKEWLKDEVYDVLQVNAVGEGMMNVCSQGGDIECGDYICSSDVKGKGMKQDDDLLHNYTVAKAMEGVDWSTEVIGENGVYEMAGSDGVIYKCKMIACTYHCA